MATIKTAEDFARELGQVQLQYQQAKTAGQDTKAFEQQGQSIRQLAAAAGQDISKLGATNKYGQDYTGLVTNATPTQAPQPTAPSFADQQTQRINDIYNNQHQSQLQALRQQQQTSLQGLNKVETQAKQSAYDNRNQADAANAQAAQRLREAMANMGLLNSGDNLTNTAALNAQRQSALGQINQQEANTLTDVQERRKLINDNASGNELALMQALQAEQARQLLDLGYRGEDINFRNQQFGWGQQMDLAGLTGYYGGAPTMARQNMQYNQDMTTKQFNAQQAQQDWENTFRNQQFDFQKASQLWEQTFKEKSFDQSVNQFAKQLGVDYARMNQSQQQFIAEMAFREKAQQFEKDKFDYSKQPVAKTADDYYKVIDSSLFVTPEVAYDLSGKPNKTGANKVSDPVGLESYILSLGLPDSEAQKLYYKYGLKWGG